jgi:hypothetical protein
VVPAGADDRNRGRKQARVGQLGALFLIVPSERVRLDHRRARLRAKAAPPFLQARRTASCPPPRGRGKLARKESTVLSSLLPGLRELRAPLSAGYLWLLVLWIAFDPLIPSEDDAGGIGDSLSALGEAVSAIAIGIGVALSFAVLPPRRALGGRLLPGHGDDCRRRADRACARRGTRDVGGGSVRPALRPAARPSAPAGAARRAAIRASPLRARSCTY